MDLNLKGKTALVFGSSSGLGKAAAQSLINEGARVIISSRNPEKLEATANEIGATSFIPCDLSKPGEATKAVQKTISELGSLDILVTNTGGPAKGNFMDVSLEQWNTDYQSLWLSVIESLHASLPSMKKNNFGRVLLITSIAAKEPLAGLTTSNGLRAGLTGLVKSVATEYAPFGITFNLLLPGYTATDRLKALNLSDEKVKAMIPCGRLGDPSELADLATFLSSEKGSYITGQSIAVDGGVLKGH